MGPHSTCSSGTFLSVRIHFHLISFPVTAYHGSAIYEWIEICPELVKFSSFCISFKIIDFLCVIVIYCVWKESILISLTKTVSFFLSFVFWIIEGSSIRSLFLGQGTQSFIVFPFIDVRFYFESYVQTVLSSLTTLPNV